MKIFAFDMDGTILNNNDEVMSETIDALDELKKDGHIAVIATGRPYEDVVRSLKDATTHFNYLICNNGAYFKNVETGEVEVIGSIPHDIAKKMIDIGVKYDAFYALHGDTSAQRSYLGDNSSINWNDPEYDEFIKFKDKLVDAEEIMKWSGTQNNLFQSSLRHDTKTIPSILSEINEFSDKVSIHVANDVYIDVNAVGTSKLNGLTRIAKKHNLTNKSIVAFGDSGNDLEMLAGAGIGIAMGNGTLEAKKVANEVIGTNNSNAIAKKIRSIINIK